MAFQPFSDNVGEAVEHMADFAMAPLNTQISHMESAFCHGKN
jgi:hypothetical protein